MVTYKGESTVSDARHKVRENKTIMPLKRPKELPELPELS